MVLLGDFSTNLLQDERGDTSYEGNKMKGILEQFNMKNVVKGPTCLLYTSDAADE